MPTENDNLKTDETVAELTDDELDAIAGGESKRIYEENLFRCGLCGKTFQRPDDWDKGTCPLCHKSGMFSMVYV